MKKMKKVIAVMLSIVTMLGFVATAPTQTQAAVSVKKMNPNITYSKYDFTGDKKPDKFRYTVKNPSDGYARVYFRGKYLQKVTIARGAIIRWCKFSNGQVYLIVEFSQYGGHGMNIYRYSSENSVQLQEMHIYVNQPIRSKSSNQFRATACI